MIEIVYLYLTYRKSTKQFIEALNKIRLPSMKFELKYGFCMKLLRYKWTYDQLNTFSLTFLLFTQQTSQKEGKKVFNLSEVHFYRSNFIQNPYFRRCCPGPFNELVLRTSTFPFRLKYRGPILRVTWPALGSADLSLDQSGTSIQILREPNAGHVIYFYYKITTLTIPSLKWLS